MSHVFVCSEQDGCECDGFVQVDEGLDDQIVEIVCQFLHMTIGRMFLYVVYVEITSYYTCR